MERPNRFIAHVMLEGKQETVHVKNTGRCRELLQKGVTVYLEKSNNPNRSTAYDLVAVEKGKRLINMDSQAPNKVVEEWLYTKAFFPDLILVRPETKYGNSRFDFYVETEYEKIFMEVKGVTLEENGVVRFPDAPSDRAVKHVEELIQAKKDGYRVFVLFVIQMETVSYFTPNADTHPEFTDALIKAAEEGVEILAYDCKVTSDSLSIHQPVKVVLNREIEGNKKEKATEFEEEQVRTCKKAGTKADKSEKETVLKRGKESGLEEKNRKNLEEVKRKLRLGEISCIPKPLLTWYDSNRRILPWRENPTPYRVWVSEIMLQQTRVEAVKPYFERFMQKLPNIEALAQAPEEELLKLWEGLGYYNRVRNMQKAAIQIMEEYDGRMPDSYDEILKLKGIGSYTAGAISSIAYGKVHPAVDGNVLRVLARIRKDERLITDAKVKNAVELELKEVMLMDRPGDFNQAMMELGACVCIPNGAPHCDECPLQDICRAHAERVEQDYPKKASAKARTIEEKTVLVIQDADRTVIRKREDRGLLAGMYEFPTLSGYRTAEEVTGYLAENGLQVIRVKPLTDAKHVFTHKEWHMKGYMVRVDELAPRGEGPDSKDWLFIEPGETREKYPIPTAFAAYTKVLKMKHGMKRYPG